MGRPVFAVGVWNESELLSEAGPVVVGGAGERLEHRPLVLPWVALALSGALVRQGRVEHAAVLVASAEATAERLGLRENAGDAPENAQIRAMIAAQAGDHLPKWRSRGRAMPLDEALRIALDASGGTAERPDSHTSVP